MPQDQDEHKNLQDEIYFETTRFRVACDQRRYRKCVGYAHRF